MKTRAYFLGCGLVLVLVSVVLAQNDRIPAPNPGQIAELVLANQIIANEEIVDAYGHVSVRDERNPNHYLLARGIAAGTVTAADIVEYDLDSVPVRDPKATGFSERFIHGEIYKLRPEVMSIVHFHPPDLLPFTVTNVPLRAMVHVGGFIPQQVPIFGIRTVGGMTDMLVRNNEFGKALATMLGDKPLILLRGHGAVVAATNLHIAVGMANYTIVNARAQLDAMALAGDKVTYLDPQEAAKANVQDGFERAWAFWKHKLGK